MQEILFPKRKSLIKTVKLSSFSGNRRGAQVYAANIEVENGDVFTAYSKDGNLFSSFTVGTNIEYVLMKTENKTKVKSIQIVKKKQMKPLLSNLDGTSIDSLLFIDIETVRVVDELEPDTPLYESWAYKRRKEDEEVTPTELVESFARKAPLYSEFGKIVTISIGMVKNGEVFIQSYYGDLERDILTQFAKVIDGYSRKFPNLKLCGHSIIGFDIPYIIRRMIVNGVRVPDFINTVQEKPWTVDEKVLDIGTWWKNTGFYGASLINIAVTLDIDSPKQELDGAGVSDAYYDGGLIDVAKYCEQDVFAVVKIMQHLYNIEKSTTFTSKTFENEQKPTKKTRKTKSNKRRVSRR